MIKEFQNKFSHFTQQAMFKFASKVVDTAALMGRRPEAMGSVMDTVDGRLQRYKGGERLILSSTTLWKMAHMDPITWAIINKFKTRITKMKWTIGPDIEDQITELHNWEKLTAAYLSPFAPSGFKPVYENSALDDEMAKKLESELMKLTAKTPDARLKARWLFDQAETELHGLKSLDAVKLVDFFKQCNKDTVDPFKDLLEFIIDGLCTYDAFAIIKRRTKGGDPLEMYAIENGSQVVRYRNPDLSTPQPPDRAYAWEMNGRMVAEFTTDQLLYGMANPQPGGYGFSPIEATVHTIMASLYADAYNLDAFRSQIPPAIMNLGPVTDQQRIRFRTEWANEVMGRGGVHRLMFVNTKSDKSQLQLIPMEQLTQKEMQFMDYLKWTLVVKCMCFQISPQDIGFTADLHRTTAEVQEHISSEGVLDMANLLENYINTGIIRDFFGVENLAFRFTRDEAAPDAERAKMDDLYVRMGALSINEIRERLGKRPLVRGGDEPFIMTRTEILPVSAIFGRDSATDLDVTPGQEGVVSESSASGTDPGAIQLTPQNKSIQDTTLQKGKKREAVLLHRKNRKGIYDTFAQDINRGAKAAKEKALEAIRNALAPKGKE